MAVTLPEAFAHRMKEMLGEEFPAFLAAYEQPYLKGVRINPLKCAPETLLKAMGGLRPSPFSPLCFYSETEKVGALPLHHAGAFYSQEPSASSAVTVLDPQPGERVLDLCAAPGGKSTQIAACLMGEGLLWSNEIVRSRASILLSNMERMGVKNGVVSSCHPETLCSRLAGFFDKVLVDAPCSGEGMFRRDPQAVAEWSPEHVRACADRQLAILHSAKQAVREGGVLVYWKKSRALRWKRPGCLSDGKPTRWTPCGFIPWMGEKGILPPSCAGFRKIRIFPDSRSCRRKKAKASRWPGLC